MIRFSDIKEIMNALDYEFKDAINIDEDWSELRGTIEHVLKYVLYMQAQRKEQEHE